MEQTFDQILGCARDNDVQGVTALLTLGCPPSYANRVGQSALHIGAMWGSVDAVKALLKAKANPNLPNSLRGSTPLHAAAMGRGPADTRAICASLIIQAKGNPNLPDKGGETPLDCAEDEAVRIALGGTPMILHNAIKGRHLEELTAAIQNVKKGSIKNLTLDSSSGDGDTALHAAVAAGWDEAAQLILEAKADASLENAKARAPLHTAVLAGNHIMIAALLASKASPSTTDRDPDHDYRFSSQTFQETPDKHRTPLHYAAGLGNVIAIQALIGAGGSVNAKDSKGNSPMHLCLDLRNNPDIDTGCGVRVAGLQNRAEWNGRLGAVLGPPAAADGNEDNMRCPVLLQGLAKGVLLKVSNLELVHEEALDMLLDAKADVNAGNHSIGESMTVLHEAARRGDAHLAEKLIGARANLDQVDSKQGLSPLHLAARGKHLEMIKVLVAANAQVGLPASNGKTAADLAKANRASSEIIALLDDSAKATAYPSTEKKQDTLAGLTKEQRAALFLD